MDTTHIRNASGSSESDSNPAGEASNLPRYLRAFEACEAEIAAVPDAELVAINVDVLLMIGHVLRALANVAPLRAEIAKIPQVDHARIDRLEQAALALGHAQSLWCAATTPTAVLPELGQSAVAVRERLAADATALAGRGLLDAARVEALHSGVGYRAVANDTLGLVSLLREAWDSIQGRTAVSPDELHEAEDLCDRIVVALGDRAQSAQVTTHAAQTRQRAYALVFHGYDELRRAVALLRWHEGDAEKLAPSLFAGRGGRPKAEPASDRLANDAAGTDPSTGAGAAPTPLATSLIVPIGGDASPVPGGATSATNKIPQGLPGAPPFIS